ncbi:MAG: flagellar filament capping protein FliD [Pseudomonadota bacterium]
MAISAAGMLSGLDVDGLVTSLMSIERQPLYNLQSKQSSFNSKLSAFGTLKSAVSAFQTAVKNVSADALSALTATSSKSETIGVSVAKASSASAGSYSIEVSKLAQSDKLVSSGVATGTTFSAANSSMAISVNGKTTTLTLTDTTLSGLSSAINKANAGVTATILNDGTSDRLVITGNETGDKNAVTIAATGSLAQFDTTGGSMTKSQSAQNAELTIDGIAVSKPSNTVTDAIKGVTLNLNQTNVGSPVKVSLAKDLTAVTNQVTAFVDAYNTLATAVNKQTAFNATTKTSAVLNGDASARSILTNIRAELGKAVTDSTGLKTLSDIGIAFQRDGTLKLEKPDKLKSALETNFAAVSSLFSGTDGVATRLTKVTEEMLGSKGLFKTRTDGLNASIESMNDSMDRMELQLAQTEKRYRAQFTALDTMMTNMQSMSSYMTQQLAAIAANSGY